MKWETIAKSATSAAGGICSVAFGDLAAPVFMMVACNVIDYATGLIAAPQRGQGISSYKGLRGIAKKVCLWLLVAVGGILDQLLQYASGMAGFQPPGTFLVAAVVAVWIVCNEIISILENLADIGVPMPGFLMPLVRRLKEGVEAAAEEAAGQETEEGNEEAKE